MFRLLLLPINLPVPSFFLDRQIKPDFRTKLRFKAMALKVTTGVAPSDQSIKTRLVLIYYRALCCLYTVACSPHICRVMGAAALQKYVGGLEGIDASGVGSTTTYAPKDLNKEITPEKIEEKCLNTKFRSVEKLINGYFKISSLDSALKETFKINQRLSKNV